MIVLDTHVWIWWVQGEPRLPRTAADLITQAETTGLGVSAISCWEIAKLVERGRLVLPCPVEDWLDTALGYPGVELVPISPRIAVESTQLPGDFHDDPADQLIVATARVLDCPLMTADQKIRAYPHVTVHAIT
ncbi:MAG: type II toxin-antitoxin system VapC family toxin [Minicystis sp.]